MQLDGGQLAGPSVPDSRAITIVLADDVPDVLDLIRMQLEFDGCFRIVGEAGDGAEAVTVVGDEQPDIVLLDLAMPVMDGLSAIPQIRSVSPSTRVVILSGFSESKMRERVVAAGAEDYIEKGSRGRAIADRLERIHRSPRRFLT